MANPGVTTTMWRRVVVLVSVGVAAVLLTAGCTTTPSSAPHSSSAATSTTPVAQACRVTPPTQSDIPSGIAAQQYGSVFNEGNLWVGAWWDDPASLKQARKKGLVGVQSYGYKYPTWKVQDGKVTGAGGTPRISVKPLDGHGHGSGQVGGYASATMDDGTIARWWPTVTSFSRPGCWQVTETLGDDTLVYVVKI
jgi:hypothetical protein